MFKINIIMKNNKHFKKKIVLLIIVVLYFMSLTVILGKYAIKNVQKILANSQKFYFYSDTLLEGGAEYTVNWNGSDLYTIPINLYTKDKENNFAKAKEEIKYEIKYRCSNGLECTLDKEIDTISAEDNMDQANLKITSNSENIEDAFVEITVNTLETYAKTLKATYKFTRVTGQDVSVKIEDEVNREYFNLIINNMQAGNKNIIVEFNPADVLIDSTNKIINSDNIIEVTDNLINKIEFEVKSMSSINIKYYKKDKSKKYTLDASEDGLNIKINEEGGVNG